MYPRRLVKLRSLALAGICSLLLAACGDKKQAPDDANFLVRVGSTLLTQEDLDRAMPSGLTPEDSAKYVKVYVKDWIDSHLVSDYASQEIDMTEIDRLTNEYRNRLILLEFRRKLFETQGDSIPEDSIRLYHEAHKDEFVLERPLIKGVYLKVPVHAANLGVIKRLYKSSKPADIDRLEKESLSSAVHYDYFRDHWVDWEQVETRIPYAFGDDAAGWLSKHRNFEVTVGNYVYLLNITEVLDAGHAMPLEMARGQVVMRLLNKRRAEFDNMVSRQLYSTALESGRLEVKMPID